MTVIRDVMHQPVLTVCLETTLGEAVEILTRHPLGDVPVVSADGTLVGFISEVDLIDVVFDASAKYAPVSQYLNPDIPCVQPDAPLSQAAKLFALHATQRIPVVEGGKFVGILNCCDLLNHSLCSNELLTEPLLELLPER